MRGSAELLDPINDKSYSMCVRYKSKSIDRGKEIGDLASKERGGAIDKGELREYSKECSPNRMALRMAFDVVLCDT